MTKKTVPYLKRIESCYEPMASEISLLWRYNRVIDEGYTLSVFDFYCYCSLLIRHMELEQIPKIMLNGTKLKPLRFHELILY
jgi:hypothetical protein